MDLYVASSWRNRYQPRVVELARAAGLDTYDFRNPAALHTWNWVLRRARGGLRRFTCPRGKSRNSCIKCVAFLLLDFEALFWRRKKNCCCGSPLCGSSFMGSL